MATNNIPLSSVLINVKNPRSISAAEFKRLVNSLKSDPEIMFVNPLVLHSVTNPTLLAGEQRYKALLELGYTEIPETWILYADALSEDQRDKFILLDNDHAGEWDISKLTDGWDVKKIVDWDIKIPGLEDTLEIPGLLQIDPISAGDTKKAPSATDNNYSVFELVMLHPNKLKLLEVLNSIKQEQKFEKLEDAVMHLVELY